MSTMEEEIEKMKQYFKDKYKFVTEHRTLFKDRYENAKPNMITPFKTYSAFAFILYGELGDLFEILENIYENLVELDKDITNKTQKLEKIIQELGGHVGAEIDGLKSTLKEPMWARIDEFLQTMKEAEERRKKAGDFYVE